MTLASASVRRPRSGRRTLLDDELETALCRVLGGSSPAAGTIADGKRRRALADLQRHDATPEGVALAARRYVERYGHDRLTDTALATHYPQLVAKLAEPNLPLLNGEEMT